MKSTLLKICMLTAVLLFGFAGASWADNQRGHRGLKGSVKRIHSNDHGGTSHYHPVLHRNKDFQRQKHVYQKRHINPRPIHRYWHYNFYYGSKWIKKQNRYMKHKWHRSFHRNVWQR